MQTLFTYCDDKIRSLIPHHLQAQNEAKNRINQKNSYREEKTQHDSLKLDNVVFNASGFLSFSNLFCYLHESHIN